MAHGKKRPDVYQEINNRLSDMASLGESKRAAVKEGTAGGKIFSSNTLRGYRHECHTFARWAADHSEAGRFVSFEELRELAPRYLSERKAAGYSVSSLKKERAAIAKLLGCPGPDLGDVGVRHRADITRGRRPMAISEKTGKTIKNRSTYAGRFSETKHPEVVTFCRSTGLRKTELSTLRGCQIMRNDGPAYYEDYSDMVARYREVTGKTPKELRDAPLRALVPSGDYLLVQGKGGRVRCAPVLPEGAALVRELCRQAGDGKVWKKLPSNLDAHSYRAQYARAVYASLDRDLSDIREGGTLSEINKIEIPGAKKEALGEFYRGHVLELLDAADPSALPIPRSEVYFCRGDLKGRSFDKVAMSAASEALGHSRISVVASNYFV